MNPRTEELIRLFDSGREERRKKLMATMKRLPQEIKREETKDVSDKPWQVMKDANEFNQAHEDVLREMGEKHI